MGFRSKWNLTGNFIKPEFSTKSGQTLQWQMKGPRTQAQFINQEAPIRPDNNFGLLEVDVLSIHLNLQRTSRGDLTDRTVGQANALA